MMTRRGSPSPAPEDRSPLHASLANDDKNTTPAVPMAPKDTWNFALLVVLCKGQAYLVEPFSLTVWSVYLTFH